MKTMKQTLELFIIGLVLGILLYGLLDSLIGLVLILVILYGLYKLTGQELNTKGGCSHD